MPAKPLTPDQRADAARLKTLFEQWQRLRRAADQPHSQEDIAEQLEFGQSALSQYLNGKIPLNAEALLKFSALLQVPSSTISPSIVEAERARAERQAFSFTAITLRPANDATDHETLRAQLEVAEPSATYAGQPSVVRRVPVIGEAKLGQDGHYEEAHPPGGDGTVDGYSSDPDAYALRVRGDSMHPAIRHGSFVVVEPHGRCVTGEYVALQLVDGRKMVKELIIERPTEIVVESVNGNSRQTIERSLIERMHPVAAVVSPSKWRSA